VYNRYIPQGEPYTPVEHREQRPECGKEKRSDAMERLAEFIRGGKFDTGDLLLALIVLLIWKDSRDTELLLALGAAMLLGDGDT